MKLFFQFLFVPVKFDWIGLQLFHCNDGFVNVGVCSQVGLVKASVDYGLWRDDLRVFCVIRHIGEGSIID